MTAGVALLPAIAKGLAIPRAAMASRPSPRGTPRVRSSVSAPYLRGQGALESGGVRSSQWNAKFYS
jgi:hypothetical protein